ncbi:hypothetical protein F4774DRAFT_411833 [Daldinia eschscholtzii]|nr:hypothetical protein F4774DRAFT_411833 [Daldinia eschscholtzii]
MTGKFWSPAEEKYFWKTVVAHSVKRAPADLDNEEKTWEELAVDMQKAMDEQGTARRWYSGSVLFEHYFQNVEGDRRSPNATQYVIEYMKKLGPFRRIVNPRSGPRGGRPRRREVTIVDPPVLQAPPPSPDGFTVTPSVDDDVFSPEYAARQASRSRQAYQSRQLQAPPSPTRPQRRRRLQQLAPAPPSGQAQENSSEGASNNPNHITWEDQISRHYVPEQSQPQANLSSFDTLVAAAEFVSIGDTSTESNQDRNHFQIQPFYPSASGSYFEDASGNELQSHTLDCASSNALAYSSSISQEYYQNTVSNPLVLPGDSTSGLQTNQWPLSSSYSSTASTLYDLPANNHISTGDTTEEEDNTVRDDENKENEGGLEIDDLQLQGFKVYRSNPIPQDFIIYEDGQIVQNLQPSEVPQGQGNFELYDDNKENEGIQGTGGAYYENDLNAGSRGMGGSQEDIFGAAEELSLASIPPFSNW